MTETTHRSSDTMTFLRAGTTCLGSCRLLTFAWEWACSPECLQLATTELDTEHCALCLKHDLIALHLNQLDLLIQKEEHLSEVSRARLMLVAPALGM